MERTVWYGTVTDQSCFERPFWSFNDEFRINLELGIRLLFGKNQAIRLAYFVTEWFGLVMKFTLLVVVAGGFVSYVHQLGTVTYYFLCPEKYVPAPCDGFGCPSCIQRVPPIYLKVSLVLNLRNDFVVLEECVVAELVLVLELLS